MLFILVKVTSPDVVGEFALATAVVSPLIIFANFQLRHIQASDSSHQFRFSDYLFTRAVTGTIVMTVVVAIIATRYRGQSSGPAILLMMLSKIVESFSDICLGRFQQHELFGKIAFSTLLRSAVQVAVFTVAVALTRSAAIGTFGLLIGAAIVLVCYDLPRCRDHHPEDATSARHSSLTRKRAFLRLAQLGLPLGLVVGINSLISSMPRYALEARHGAAAVGVYSALAYLTIIGSQIIGASSDVALPRLAKLYSSGDRRGFIQVLTQLTLGTVLIGILGVTLAGLFGRQFLAVLYRPEYAAQATAFTWLMASCIPVYAGGMIGVGLTAMRSLKVQVAPRLIQLPFAWLAFSYFIREDGLLGAAVATTLVSAVFGLSMVGILVYELARTKTEGAARSVIEFGSYGG
jgi:O-antigen/teichoic acid export membrane protein